MHSPSSNSMDLIWSTKCLVLSDLAKYSVALHKVKVNNRIRGTGCVAVFPFVSVHALNMRKKS